MVYGDWLTDCWTSPSVATWTTAATVGAWYSLHRLARLLAARTDDVGGGREPCLELLGD